MLAEQLINKLNPKHDYRINDTLIIFYDKLIQHDQAISNFYDILPMFQPLKKYKLPNCIEEICITNINNDYTIYFQIVYNENVIYKTPIVTINKAKAIQFINFVLTDLYVIKSIDVRFNSKHFKNICIMNEHFDDYIDCCMILK